MNILRERTFITHDHKNQRSVMVEFTMQSNRDNLTNLLMLSETFLPNLTVVDESENILPIMSTDYVVTLLNKYSKTGEQSEKEKIKLLVQQIQEKKVYLIWVKIPKNAKLANGEIKNIILRYSSVYNQSKTALTMKIKKKAHPWYCTLYTPNNFNFKQTTYKYFDQSRMTVMYKIPPFVEEIRTYNSYLIKVKADIKFGVEVKYAFQPQTQATRPIKLGFATLTFFGGIFLLLKLWSVITNELQWDLFDKNVEIGIFIMAGSLILPQLTTTESIRSIYVPMYIIPIILGGLIVIW